MFLALLRSLLWCSDIWNERTQLLKIEWNRRCLRAIIAAEKIFVVERESEREKRAVCNEAATETFTAKLHCRCHQSNWVSWLSDYSQSYISSSSLFTVQRNQHQQQINSSFCANSRIHLTIGNKSYISSHFYVNARSNIHPQSSPNYVQRIFGRFNY